LLSTLGGVIGTAIFENGKGNNATNPLTQNFGGAGSYGSGV